MKFIVERTERLEGTVRAPPSKSHTHRAIIIASLARGESAVKNPLSCGDTLATVGACRKFGALIEGGEELRITGVAGKPVRPDSDVDVRDSGTAMRFMAAVFALCKGATVLTCGESLRKRPMGPLLASLLDLGAPRARSLGGDGRPPVCVGGKMTGGATKLDAESSQYLSALLLACTQAENDSMIEVSGLRSKPYAAMTLEHLERAGARVWAKDMSGFFIPGSQPYRPTAYSVPGDYSSAAFLQAAGLMTDSDVRIEGLDAGDVQGDKIFTELAERILSGGDADIDLSDAPDLLPALAAVACRSDGTVTLSNVGHARQKESDRIAVMAAELGKMGADISELADGLRISGSKLRGAELDAHGDHRVAMALAVAGLAAEGRTIINGADTISKSYPGFARDLASLGANIREAE